MADLLEEIETADRAGLHSFGIGEHHRPEYYDSAPPVILAAAAARDQVQGGELLEDADRVGGAEDGHGAAQPDPGGARGGGTEDHRRRRVVVLGAVVLTDAEGVQAHLVGEGDLLEQVGHALLGADEVPGRGVGHCCDEAVDAEVHGCPPGGSGRHRRRSSVQPVKQVPRPSRRRPGGQGPWEHQALAQRRGYRPVAGTARPKRLRCPPAAPHAGAVRHDPPPTSVPTCTPRARDRGVRGRTPSGGGRGRAPPSRDGVLHRPVAARRREHVRAPAPSRE